MTAIVWETPPAKAKPGAKANKWASIAAALVEHLGEWALVHHGNPHTTVKNYLAKSAPGVTFEVTSRRQADGTVKVYARAVSA